MRREKYFLLLNKNLVSYSSHLLNWSDTDLFCY